MAKRIAGITIVIDGDTTKLQKALKDVNQQIGRTSKDLRDINKLLKLDPGNADLLAQKQRTLASAIESTRQKLQEMKAITRDQVGSDREWDALQREIVETEQKLKGLEQEYKNFGTVSSQQVAAAGEKMKATGDKIAGAGRAMMPVSAAVAGAGAAAVKTAADFESSMATLQATTGASGKEMQALEKKARKMGQTTQYSASESAEAMNYMAMAGWKTEDMLKGLDGVMYLASASGEDLALTSDIVTDGLTAFGLSAKDSTRMANVMAAAASNANTDVKGMGEAFKYAAPVAGSLGFTLEDTTVAMGLMANAGIKGSQAGTALRSGMTNLVKPSKQAADVMAKYGIAVKNADGSMKPLSQIMQELRTKLGGLSEAEQAAAVSTIFGKEAMSGWLGVINASDKDFNKLTKAVDNSAGAAKKMSDIKMNTLEGQIKTLTSALQELGISIGQTLLPYVTAFVKWLTKVINFINGLPKPIKNVIIVLGLIVAALGPVLLIVGNLMSAVGSIMMYAPQIASAISSISAFLTGTLIPAIQGFIAAFGPIIAVVGGAILAVTSFVDMFKNGFSAIKEILMGVGVAIAAIGAVLLGAPALVAGVIAAIVFAIANLIIAIKNGFDIKAWLSGIAETIMGWLKSVGSAITGALQAFWGVVGKYVQVGLMLIVEVITSYIELITLPWRMLWENFGGIIKDAFKAVKSALVGALNAIKTTLVNGWKAVKTAITPIIEGIKSAITAAWSSIKSAVSAAVRAIKSAVTSAWNGIRAAVAAAVNATKSVVTGAFNAMKSAGSAAVNGLKNTVRSAFATIRNVVSSAVSFLKNAFHFNWDLPKIKLPHFSISGNFSLDPPSVPDFSISWYKKAYDNAYMLTNPTIFGAAGGKLLGGGEGSGSEIVVGTEKLMGMIRDAAGQTGDIIIPVYLGNERIDELVVDAAQRVRFRSGGR